MHREDHECRIDAGPCGNFRDQIGKGKERRIAGAHDDAAGGNDSDHDQCQSGSTEACILCAFDECIDGTGGGESLGEEFTGNDDRYYIGQLAAHAVKENLQLFADQLGLARTDELGEHADGRADEHGHDDVHFNGGNAQRGEYEDERQRDDRQNGENFRRMAGHRLLFCHIFRMNSDVLGAHGTDHMAVSLIHDLLCEIMNNGHNGNDEACDRNLVGMPVHDRIQAADFRGKDRAGVRRAPVKAERGGNGGGGCNTGYAECHEDREHGHHEEHGQTGGTVDGQTEEHAQYPAGAHDDIGRFQFQKRGDGEIDQCIAGADLVHEAGKSADGHDIEPEAGHAVGKEGADELKQIKSHKSGAFAFRQNGTVSHDDRTGQQDAAGHEEYGLRLVALDDEPAGPYRDESCKNQIQDIPPVLLRPSGQFRPGEKRISALRETQTRKKKRSKTAGVWLRNTPSFTHFILQ